MTQEEKQLLLKDLCARLPYNVKINIKDDYSQKMVDDILCAYHIGGISYNLESRNLRPYLRPMSSMTEEECITLSRLKPCNIDAWKYIKTPVPLYVANIEQFDFFHRHHLDWRGLIPMGLALEAPEGMYNKN